MIMCSANLLVERGPPITYHVAVKGPVPDCDIHTGEEVDEEQALEDRRAPVHCWYIHSV